MDKKLRYVDLSNQTSQNQRLVVTSSGLHSEGDIAVIAVLEKELQFVGEEVQRSEEYKSWKELAPSVKPPIGIMPKRIWIEERIEGLTGAINRYIKTPTNNTPELVRLWSQEIVELSALLVKEEK